MIDLFWEAITFAFFQRALLVGSLLAMSCAFMGVFVVLRREVIVSHAISHLALLGIALGFILNVGLTWSVAVTALIGVVLIFWLQRTRRFGQDSVLEFVAESSIAAATVLVSLFGNYRGDLLQYLFGDILALTRQDVWLAVAVAALVAVFGWLARVRLLQSLFNEELALSAGVNNAAVNLLFTLLLALVVAVALKIVGAILIAAFLVIPANTAKTLAGSFRGMLIWALVFAWGGTTLGLFLSYAANTPSGSTIVLTMAAIFLLTVALRRR